MTGQQSLAVGGGVTTPLDARHDVGGLLAVQGPTALDIRTGVLHGPGSTALVTGTSDTGPMTVQIGPHVAVTSRGTANGAYLGPSLTAATKVNIAAAPASGQTRIDVVYVKQQDGNSGVPSPDVTTAPLYGVLTGTAATSGLQVKPDLSTVVGAVELATVQVAAGATATNGANVTITNTAQQTVARGAPIPVRSQAERDAIGSSVGYPGLSVRRLDVAGLPVETYSGTGTNWYRLGGDTGWVNCSLNSPWTGPCVARMVGSTVEVRWDLANGSAANGAFTSLGSMPAGIPAPSGATAVARGGGLSSNLPVPVYITSVGTIGFVNSTGATRTAVTGTVVYLAG